ncbi:MAG: hypothetical protein SOZ36_07170 [Atopobiaceae bacterium]|nr:hypothetical protein [Olsenella sp.]MDY3901436.1 hypothetical protein [Atopobiaceae bacterium]
MREDDRREGPRAASETGVSRAGANAVGAGASEPGAGPGEADSRVARSSVGKPGVTGAGTDRPSPYASFIRAENEDDDGYDPYSDRPARAEPLFERDPWD